MAQPTGHLQNNPVEVPELVLLMRETHLQSARCQHVCLCPCSHLQCLAEKEVHFQEKSDQHLHRGKEQLTVGPLHSIPDFSISWT